MATSEPRRLSHQLALFAIMLAAAALRLWRLDQNGFGNEYYSAGVRSMTASWHAVLYNSFDPAGFVSVDKPPVAFWIQAASAKLLGFNGLSVHLPQVVEGLAAVVLLYHLVRRQFGGPAGLLAALFLALTPVSVAVDRSTNTESCLILVLLLAAWALIVATERASRGLLLLAMAILGLGFNVKMLAALVVLPTFALVYVLGASATWRRRVVDLVLSGVVLAIVSLSWTVAFDLTPVDRRPYAGTTDKNSMLELVVGPYGVGRFVRSSQFRSGPSTPVAPQRATAAASGDAAPERPPEPGPRRGLQRLFVGVPVGLLRLADGQLAGQASWLVPFAAMGLVLAAARELPRIPLGPTHLALLVWAGWALAYGVVYSYAGGFFHFYYLSTLAPPLAALAAIGVVKLWSHSLGRHWRTVLLPMTLLLTAAWQLYIDASALGWKLGQARDLHLAQVTATLVAIAGLLLVPVLGGSGRARAVAMAALTVGLAAVLLVPTAWALSSVLVVGPSAVPSADLARLLPSDRGLPSRTRFEPVNTTRLTAFLVANHRAERYLLATSSTRLAAPIIIATGRPVMAMGGFHGLDPIMTPEKLARMVEVGEVRFVTVGDLPIISRRLGAEAATRPITEWVQSAGKLVDPALWRASAETRRSDLKLYDLKPDTDLVPAAD